MEHVGLSPARGLLTLESAPSDTIVKRALPLEHDADYIMTK